MMAWSPIILFAVMMIGYPLIQIAAIRLRRNMRLKFNAQIADLRARHPDGVARAAIDGLMAESRGPWWALALPVIIPTAGVFCLVRMAIIGREAMDREMKNARHVDLEKRFGLPQNDPIWCDKQFVAATETSFGLMLYSHPISALFALVVASPLLLLDAWLERHQMRRDRHAREFLSERVAYLHNRAPQRMHRLAA